MVMPIHPSGFEAVNENQGITGRIAIGGNAGGNILPHHGPITGELGELLTLWQSMTDEARRALLAAARGLT